MVSYLKRILKPRQMDLEYTSWLMLQLLISPKTVYRQTAYHKQAKNQWSRDDPAFVVVSALFVFAAALSYCITFGNFGAHAVLTLVSAVVVDYLLIGIVFSTACWLISNRFLRRKPAHPHQVEQYVEWLYAFDVHCNSFFPFFIVIYVVQFFFTPVLMHPGRISSLASTILYAASFAYYHYLSFLGYSSLPFLEKTQVFLWPAGAIILLLTPLCVLTGFNPTNFTLGIYFGH